VGRGHLIGAAALGASLPALALPAASLGGIRRRTAADSPAPGRYASATVGLVALDRNAAGTLSGRLTAGGRAALARVDFARDAAVAIFGPFGRSDHRVSVESTAQRGTTLSIRLGRRPPAPGTAECTASYETFRLLVVPKSSLTRPSPTRAVVTGA
jgi:hypothetical protein